MTQPTRQTLSINRKSAPPQGSAWQDTLRDYKAHMTSKKQQQTQQGAPESDKTTSAHKVKPDSDRTPQKYTGVKINASEPQESTSEAGQESHSGNKPQSGKPATHQKQKTPHNALQCVSDGKDKKPAQERVRPEGMNRRQWKNLKNVRRVLAFWPELFDLDNPKPLKTGVLNDLMQDIAARDLTIGAGALKAALASYTRRIRYKKAIAAGGARYDLNGQPCGEITPEQQQTAADGINKAKGERDKGNGHDRSQQVTQGQ
ncbi:ProQ/FinO family protein [Salmonella enterica subsp. enterica serovar Newport]|nr:ProQ/FinO family protein [Salmonella enterica subsp. enterica serovar Newport]